MSAKRHRAGSIAAAVLGVMLIGLGVTFLLGDATGAARPWQRLFALRDLFLGIVVLTLVVLRERRALAVLIVAACALPAADTLALGPLIGWRSAALINLPFEVPLLVAAVLLAPALRRVT